jgi:DNA-binding response OmpR family regulator
MARREEGAVLIVERDDFMRLAIEEYCRGYAPTVSVTSLEKAVKALDRRLSATIVDIGLSDRLGLSILEKVRERRPGLPVLALAGEAPEVDMERARELGVELLDRTGDLNRLGDFLKRAMARRVDSEPHFSAV